ncbi:hypothetical protein KIN20_017307 [Parelaphostrongylus tenuis]|uniref:Laminin G domain-containing protein n=1 Tax=Parelaphostrongylus tenuis TaxID=148309 RepID=A0AAD5MN20_PARTN|nr:hypothetical protein KIN20_017307 [Parelaphostrongylus tenuis]
MLSDIYRCVDLLFIIGFISVDAARHRRSCRHHYLANVYKTSVLPLRGEAGVFNIVCYMPSDGDDVITTEVHSGLSRAHKITRSRSIQYQILDLSMLREMIRTSECEQSLTVSWERVPVSKRSRFTLVSLLNESFDVNYVEGSKKAEYTLVGAMAGIRHILPHNWNNDIEVTLVASPLLCKQKTILLPNCLFRSQVVVGIDTISKWTWEFAFRTQRSDQTLFSLHTTHSQAVHIRIENDFFLRVDSEPLIAIGQLSDGFWHTVTIYSHQGKVFFTVDNSHNIDLLQFPPHESKLSSVAVEVEGEILLIDPYDISENCELNERRQLVGSAQEKPFCSGCDCSILRRIFENVPPFTCSHSDEEAYHLMRDTDRLSFFFVRSSFKDPEHSRQGIRIGLSYKSDSDIGLLLFGFWQNEEEKGRFQVHYTGRKLIGIYCVNTGEEVCRGCTLYRTQGFGNDAWNRILFFEIDSEVSLVVDRDVCTLRQHNISNNFSLAEVYSIPVLATGSAVFIGGTYYEKKRSGLYLPSFEHKYFENTREKVPSLRGCLKDVYIDGTKVDLSSIYTEQKKTTLTDPTDDKAYAVQVGCTSCSPSCPEGVRCRPTNPRQLTFQCDCSDIEEFTLDSCYSIERLRSNPLVPLSTTYLDSSAPVLRLSPTIAAISKVWMKLSFPKRIKRRATIAQFNSHREMLFYIFVDPEGVGIHVHPNTFDQFETVIKEPISFSDQRVHLITLERKTPLGTRYVAKKSDLSIDGVHSEIPDLAKYMLNNITIFAAENDNDGSVIIHDMGIAYEYNEHQPFLHRSTNKLHQVNLQSVLLDHRIRAPVVSSVMTDRFLWREVASPSERSSPFGEVVLYTPDIFGPQQLLASSWIMYSLMLTTILCVLLTVFLIAYCCVVHRRQKRCGSKSSDCDRILRDSPDYSVKLRLSKDESISTYDGDGSIGTEDTDLNAYRDIPSHRVKIYRESMVSILVPGVDQPNNAIVVKRVPSSEKDLNAQLLSSSPAPLVNVDDQ